MFVVALAVAGAGATASVLLEREADRKIEDAAFERGRTEGMCWTFRKMVTSPALRNTEWASHPASKKVIEACDHEKAGLL
jgi:hypothetical protein